MSIHVEKLRNEPIITVTFEEPINYLAEVPEAFDAISMLRGTITNNIRHYVIFDISRIKAGFSEIVLALGEEKRASILGRADLPLSVAVVGSGRLSEMTAPTVEKAQVDAYQIPLFASLDQALAAIRP